MVHTDNNTNSIVKIIVNGEKYIFWTHANFVKLYIINFLRERFPGRLVVRELDQIDLSIPEENLPIEIQATIVDVDKNPKYSRFEKAIKEQIIRNITIYGVCWFFFDSDLLRAMKTTIRRININMVWFREYIKERKLKVFVVSHDGIIEEKQYNDFDFLDRLSQSLTVDKTILNNNKMKIYTNVVKMYGFTQSEIDKFYDDWREYCNINEVDGTDRNSRFMVFAKNQNDYRTKLYGNILGALNNLWAIDDILGLKNYNSGAKYDVSILGIFDNIYGNTRFVDRSNVCQYFPGFLIKREIWGELKGHSLNSRQFENIIKNGVGNYFWYNEDKSNIMTEQINDIEVEVKIENKDRTEQKNIDDAWG